MKAKDIFGKIFMILGVIFVGLLIYTRFFAKTTNWNKETGVDVRQEFTTAYLTTGDGQVKVFKVDSWRDFDDGDQIQFTTPEGVTYLTHASRVVLTNEK